MSSGRTALSQVNVIAIGSKITTDDKIYDAMMMASGSAGEANTVSGNENTKTYYQCRRSDQKIMMPLIKICG